MSQNSPETGWGSCSPKENQYHMAPGPGALPIPHVPVTDLGGDYDKRVRTTGVELLVPLHESENSEHLGLIQVGRETLYTELIDDIFPDSAENSVFRTRLAYHIVAGNIDLSGLKVLKGKFLEGRAIEKRDDAESILFQEARNYFLSLRNTHQIVTLSYRGDDGDGRLRNAGLAPVELVDTNIDLIIALYMFDPKNPFASALSRINHAEKYGMLDVGSREYAIDCIRDGTFHEKFKSYIY